jgi:hypothetical protein
MRAIIIATVIALLPAQAAAADQLDLICMFGKTEVRYRVDLAQQVACKDACDRIWKTGFSTAGEIRLMDTPVNYPEDIPQTITVNRLNGRLVHWIGGSVSPMNESASCEPAPFSGFPSAKF